MAHLDFSRTVIVFDLDDTLYKEADYENSGLIEVCKWIDDIYQVNITSQLEKIKKQHQSDVLDAIIRLSELSQEIKESLLWIYRLHSPEISLRKEVKDLLSQLENLCSAVVILTDGRSISQRKKLKALGISHLRAYISEEFSSQKPSPLRYEIIMRDFPASTYVYVGDNPRKDFLAPKSLNWKTIGLRGDERNIHSQSCIDLQDEHLPDFWINQLEELLDLQC